MQAITGNLINIAKRSIQLSTLEFDSHIRKITVLRE
ncbi:MAG: hypothetical protein RL335_1160, partial [Bacteroidota bacterium]